MSCLSADIILPLVRKFLTSSEVRGTVANSLSGWKISSAISCIEAMPSTDRTVQEVLLKDRLILLRSAVFPDATVNNRTASERRVGMVRLLILSK